MTEQPMSGGSYIRQKNGELKLVERTEVAVPSDAQDEPTTSGAAPAAQTKNKDA